MSAETKAKISAAKKGKKRAPFSAEHRRKLSEAHKGKRHSAEHKARIGAGRKGSTQSPEAREKIRAARTGTKASSETREKMSASQKGRKHTPETRAKIAEGNRKRVWSAESKEKLAASHRGKAQGPHTEETKKKIGRASRGRQISETTRARMSRSALRRLSEGKGAYKNTKPERVVQAALKSLGIAFDSHVNSGGFNWDLRTSDGTLIEVNGCYWHGCHTCGHGTRNVPKQKRDAERVKWATKNSAHFVTVWEHDLPNLDLRTLLA